ncbi:MAG: hypothetical protein LBR66_04785, partial [Candidatus Symbiothrix sp.]|nr:hypothetical protein [Candidatus Symbiothrix sp.]
MKKIIIYVALAVLSAVSAKAQVSIGTLNDPKATLDVRKVTPTPATAPSGIIAPNISGADLKADDQKYGAPQTGAIVYATSASPDAGVTGAKTIKVAKAGYYYFDGTIWQSFGSAEDNWFYLPSFNLPITTTGTGFTFDLYNEYKTQFTKETGDTQFVSSN